MLSLLSSSFLLFAFPEAKLFSSFPFPSLLRRLWSELESPMRFVWNCCESNRGPGLEEWDLIFHLSPSLVLVWCFFFFFRNSLQTHQQQDWSSIREAGFVLHCSSWTLRRDEGWVVEREDDDASARCCSSQGEFFSLRSSTMQMLIRLGCGEQAQGPPKDGKKRIWVDVGGGTGELDSSFDSST